MKHKFLIVGLFCLFCLFLSAESIYSAPKQKGTLPGVFSVGKNKFVSFSQGNLQYSPNYYDYYNISGSWRFASKQYEVLGTKNQTDRSTIDLFGWGTSGFNSKNPASTSDYAKDYASNDAPISYTNYDWGVYCAIGPGVFTTRLWRTLNNEECEYLLNDRPSAALLKGKATVSGVKGYILLPDDWNRLESLNFDNSLSAFSDNIYSDTEWIDMEEAGAVFLPAEGGYRSGTAMINYETTGCYWTSGTDGYTNNGNQYAYALDLGNTISISRSWTYLGKSVRLVCDAIPDWAIQNTDGITVWADELPYVWEGLTFTEAGSQTKTLHASNGCDSVVTFTLRVRERHIVLQENEDAEYYNLFADDYNGFTVTTATLNRQFAQGKWSTLCLPFNVNKGMMMSLGLYNRVYAFSYSEQLDDETIQIFFVPAQSIEAGKGYIVNANAKLAQKTSFVFPNVTVNTDADNGDITTLTGYNDGTNRGNLYLVGTLRTSKLQGTTTSNTYIMGLKDNQLYYSNTTSGTSIRAYRGFFRSETPVNASRIRIIAEGETVTELQVVGTAPSDWSDKSDQSYNSARKYIENGILYIERNGTTYNAQGQRLD